MSSTEIINMRPGLAIEIINLKFCYQSFETMWEAKSMSTRLLAPYDSNDWVLGRCGWDGVRYKGGDDGACAIGLLSVPQTVYTTGEMP